MSRSTFSGPVLSGTNKYGTYKNLGNSQQIQSAVMTQAGAAQVNQTFYVPALSQMVTVIVDVLVAFDSTTAPLTVGTAAGGTQYVTLVDAKVAGRASITFTAAQLLAMSSLAQDTTATNGSGTPTAAVVASIIPTGTATVGSVRVTIQYAQYDDRQAATAV